MFFLRKFDFPVDLVYSWCDGSDPDFAFRRAKTMAELSGTEFDPDAVTVERWTEHDELKYSIRSVCKFLPWVNKIYVLMNQKPPAWMKTDMPGLVCVQHKDVMWENSSMACFNSNAIETYIHRIPGLSEHFIYSCDDFFVGAPLKKSYFFTKNGTAIQYVYKFKNMCGRLSDEYFQDLINDKAWDTQYARTTVRVNKLLYDEFKKELCIFPSHLMDAHNRSVMEEQIESSPLTQYVVETRKHNFRKDNDIPRIAYPWRAALLGKLKLKYLSLPRPRLEQYFTLSRKPRICSTRDDIRHLRIGKTPLFCFNGTGSDIDIYYQKCKDFLETNFPEKSPFEK